MSAGFFRRDRPQPSAAITPGPSPRGRGGNRTSLWALLVLVALSSLLASCGGGGGGTPTGPPPPTPSIIFTPSGTSATNAITLATGVGTDANNLFLDVRAANVQGLYGVSFDLRVPSLLRFTGRSQGTFLTSGGVQTSFQVIENPTGNLVIALTRLGSVEGVDGSGLLMTLQFSASAAGTGAFEVLNSGAFGSTGQRLTTSFGAGSVQVIR